MKSQKGITLIALVITIIVMLILVGVSITMAVQGGLFGYAGKAVQNTKQEQSKENYLGTGKVNVNGNEQDINTIVNGYINPAE